MLTFSFMQHMILANTLLFYGCFLILCGILAVMFIGLKAKTAMVSGGASGGIALLISYFSYQDFDMAPLAGLFLSMALFIVFSWRSTKTLYTLFHMIPATHPDLKGKGIAFLIISLMAVVSLMAFAVQFVFILAH